MVAALGLAICSLVTLNGATRGLIAGQPHYYTERQAVYFGVGLGLMVALSRIDYSRLRELKYGFYAILVGTILLVLVLGRAARGSVRAISLPFFSFQASELGKILLIVFLASVVVDRSRRSPNGRRLPG